MQVSYAHEHVTHAVIGGGTTIDFGISNSAEFFNILSSTLYKDQILAVVRESLCNAWDAHIEAGCTDIPVLVTLDNNKLTIKDNGLGIHHDDIGLIYGTYGNSTKKNDGSQTGGFGLGCKSPFAYTDHFEVISNHAGVRTIYAMAKSSAEVGGKPGIKTIAQFHTTETGLSVTINIKPHDVQRFRDLIKRIAANGDMNIHLNGVQIPGINFDVSKSNWVINTLKINDGTGDRVNIRYGNVIYPVDGSHKDIKKEFDKVCEYLSALQNGQYHQRSDYQQIIFQAPPHSIAVTPSRESLSMQDHTVNTLKKLFSAFLAEMKADLETESLKCADAIVTEAVTAKNYQALLSTETNLPLPFAELLVKEYTVTNVAEFAKRKLTVQYPQEVNFRKQDLTNRITKMVSASMVDRGRAKTFLEQLEATKHFQTTRHYRRSEWFNRRIVGKLLTKLDKAGLDNSTLWVCDKNDYSFKYNYGGDGMVRATKACPTDVYSSLPFLRPIVVLTSARTDLKNRLSNLCGGPLDGKYSNLNGYFVYVFGRKKGDKEAAQAFFAKTDMTVVDMSELEEIEEKPVKVSTYVKKVRPKGLPKLKEVENSAGYVRTDRIKSEAEFLERITEPKFIVCINSGNERCLTGFSDEATRALIDLFGDEVGVANSLVQETNWEKKFPSKENFLIPHVLDYVKNSPAIQRYITMSTDKVQEYRYNMRNDVDFNFMPMFFKSALLRKRFALEDHRSEEEKNYTILFKYIFSNWSFYDPHSALRDEYRAIWELDIHPTVKDLLEKGAKSHLIKALEIHKIDTLLGDPAMVEKAMKMFFFALNN